MWSKVAIIATLSCCVFGQSTTGWSQPNAESVPCEVLLSYSLDKRRGLNIWEKFPKIGVSTNDPTERFFVTKGAPMAEKLWRYLNGMPADAAITSTHHYGMRVRSVNKAGELLGKRFLYASMPELFNASNISSMDKIEEAAERYLNQKMDSGAKVITSSIFRVQESEAEFPVAFISPVKRNIVWDNNEVPMDQLAAAFFEIFTNLRIEDNWFINRLFLAEYARGCLESNDASCRIFRIGRSLYRHRADFKGDETTDITQKLCRFVRADQ